MAGRTGQGGTALDSWIAAAPDANGGDKVEQLTAGSAMGG